MESDDRIFFSYHHACGTRCCLMNTKMKFLNLTTLAKRGEIINNTSLSAHRSCGGAVAWTRTHTHTHESPTACRPARVHNENRASRTADHLEVIISNDLPVTDLFLLDDQKPELISHLYPVTFIIDLQPYIHLCHRPPVRTRSSSPLHSLGCMEQ